MAPTLIDTDFPFPVRKSGSNSTFSDAVYDVQYQGKWWDDVWKNRDKLPASLITEMAKWSGAKVTTRRGIVNYWMSKVDKSNTTDPTPVPNLSPENVLDWAKALARLLDKLLDPAFWLRVAEVAAGLVLIGVGVSKLSPATGAKLRSIPAYGKAIPA